MKDADETPVAIGVDRQRGVISAEKLQEELTELVDAFLKNENDLLTAELPKGAANDTKIACYRYCIDRLDRLRNFVATWDLELYEEENV